MSYNSQNSDICDVHTRTRSDSTPTLDAQVEKACLGLFLDNSWLNNCLEVNMAEEERHLT